MIAVRGLRKTYGGVVAAAAVSFDAPGGFVTGLLGPNGAGKTTTLRAIGGLVRPDAGEAHVDGIDAGLRPLEARARLGVLPEAVGLYDRLTVAEHLQYAAALFGLRGSERASRVDAALATLDITGLAHRRAGALSLGQRRRVAIARALVHDPPNVILDEPTSGLDVLAAREVRQCIRRLAAAGRAVLVSTHVMPEAAATCDRIVVLARGRTIATGTPDEMLERAGARTLEDAFVRLIGSEEGLN